MTTEDPFKKTRERLALLEEETAGLSPTDFISYVADAEVRSSRDLAYVILVWFDNRFASVGADAVQRIFGMPLSAQGQDIGLKGTETPKIVEVLDCLAEATSRINELDSQAVVSLLTCTLPIRAHKARIDFVPAAEQRLRALRNDDIEGLMRGLR
jgi:hypothetical protein